MMDWAGWVAVAAIVTVGVLLGRMLVTITSKVNGALTKEESAVITAANKLEVERLRNDLVEHRVAVARDYVSKDALRDVEGRILDAIRHLSDRLDRRFLPVENP